MKTNVHDKQLTWCTDQPGTDHDDALKRDAMAQRLQVQGTMAKCHAEMHHMQQLVKGIAITP